MKTITIDEVKKIFGEFQYADLSYGRISISDNWRNENIIPLEMNSAKIWCNKKIIHLFAGAFAEIMAAGLWNEIDLNNGGGCFCSRHINFNKDKPLSYHSWGIALDFNPTKYPYGSNNFINNKIVAVFNKWGFYYGGLFKTPDPMHFEYCFTPI